MSDDILTAEQRAALKTKLEDAQAEALRALQLSADDAKPVGLDLSIGRLSRVDALAQQHLAASRRERLELELQMIGAALARLQSGEFGACLSCGEEIGFSRLMARPHVTLCRACQNERGA